MKTKLHNNGWTVIIEEDIKTLSDAELFEVIKIVMRNSVVVFKKQVLTEQEEVDICARVGHVVPTQRPWTKDLTLTNGIIRVSGMKNERGVPGLFPQKEEVNWHADFAGWANRKPLMWLFAAEGSNGSKTSWLRTVDVYNNLDPKLKERIKDIKMFCGFKKGNFSNSDYFIPNRVNQRHPISLVKTNAEGTTGLFFPFLQVFGFENKDEQEFNEIIELLKIEVLKEENMYHHEWDDGDVVIADEWLTLHKRWHCEMIEQRVMHRIGFLHENIYPIY